MSTVTVVQYPSQPALSRSSVLHRSQRWRMPLPAVFITLTVVAMCTAISMMLEQTVDVGTIDMVYLAGIVFVALHLGQTAAVLAVLSSLLLFDLIFVPPRWSLIPERTEFFFTFAVMLVISLLVARLVEHARLQARLAASRAPHAGAQRPRARTGGRDLGGADRRRTDDRGARDLRRRIPAVAARCAGRAAGR